MYQSFAFFKLRRIREPAFEQKLSDIWRPKNICTNAFCLNISTNMFGNIKQNIQTTYWEKHETEANAFWKKDVIVSNKILEIDKRMR